MSSVPSIAISGMSAAARSFEASARRIAAFPATSRPSASAADRTTAAPDLAEEAVNQLIARHTFAANAAVLRAHAQMMDSLIDVTA